LSNEATQNTLASGNAVAYIDSGKADCDVKLILPTTATAGYLCFRYTDINNFFVAGRSTNAGQWVIAKVVSGIPENLSVVAASAHTAGDVCKVVLDGTSIKFYVNDVLISSVTDSFNQTATKHGLQTLNSATTTFDGFSVEV
jgi:hypothetical protein